MNTNIYGDSSAHPDDSSMDISSIYPSPPEPSLGELFIKALLKNIPIFLITMCLIFMVACTSTAHHESTGEYIDDAVITTRVKAAIVADESLKVTEINVETYKGIVQLSGFVGSIDDQYKAVKIAENVSGVKSVTNDMRSK